MMIAGVFEQITQGRQMTTGQRAFFFVFGLVVFILVNGYLLAKRGQTVGKKLVGTRIVRAENEELLSLGHLFGLRYLPICFMAKIPVVGGIFSLVDCPFIFRKEKCCIHDLIAGTKVING